MLVTDLNDRERRRYAENFDSIAKAAEKVAESLRGGDDAITLVHLISFTLLDRTLTELVDIFKTAITVTLPDDSSELKST
jgi:hypothetical protein